MTGQVAAAIVGGERRRDDAVEQEPGRTKSYQTRSSRSSAALFAAWRDARRDAERRQRSQRRFEALALLAEQRVLGIVGGGEVRVDRVDREVSGCAATSGSVRSRLSWRKPSRFMPVSILRWQCRTTPWRAAAACSARAATGVEMVGVRSC